MLKYERGEYEMEIDRHHFMIDNYNIYVKDKNIGEIIDSFIMTAKMIGYKIYYDVSIAKIKQGKLIKMAYDSIMLVLYKEEKKCFGLELFIDKKLNLIDLAIVIFDEYGEYYNREENFLHTLNRAIKLLK